MQNRPGKSSAIPRFTAFTGLSKFRGLTTFGVAGAATLAALAIDVGVLFADPAPKAKAPTAASSAPAKPVAAAKAVRESSHPLDQLLMSGVRHIRHLPHIEPLECLEDIIGP